MARQTPLPRFRLETNPIPPEPNSPILRTTSTSPNFSQSHPNQRTQTRIRRSACSDLQNTAIPEERVYHGNRRRASLFVGRSAQIPIDISRISSEKTPASEGDYIKLCRQRCQSLYKSLANKTSTKVTKEISSKSNEEEITKEENDEHRKGKDDEDDDEEEEIPFQTPPRTNYRYSLPDASPAALALRNILKRNKTTKCNHVQIDLPSHSSHSLASSNSSNSSPSSSSSPISTFRNFLSLVKLPSTKSSNSSSFQHSNLTHVTNTSGGSSTTLDQTIASISPTMQWHFEVREINILHMLMTKPTVCNRISSTKIYRID